MFPKPGKLSLTPQELRNRVVFCRWALPFLGDIWLWMNIKIRPSLWGIFEGLGMTPLPAKVCWWHVAFTGISSTTSYVPWQPWPLGINRWFWVGKHGCWALDHLRNAWLRHRKVGPVETIHEIQQSQQVWPLVLMIPPKAWLAWKMTYYIILHHITSYYIILHNITSYHIILHHITPYCTILHYITPYYTILHHIVSYYIILHHITPYCTILHYITPYYTILHHIASYCIILHHTISYYTIWHHITSYCIIFHHITSYYIILHHIVSSKEV